MHANGVTCSDCHDPHTAQLRATGNAVCTTCHAPSDTPGSHHHHRTGSAGAACIVPHAVAHVHGHRRAARSRIQSATSRSDRHNGCSNTCTDCHRDKRPQWAANAIEQWFGKQRQGTARYAQAISSARGGQPDAERLLSEVLADGPHQASLAQRHSRAPPPSVARAFPRPCGAQRQTAIRWCGSQPPNQEQRCRRSTRALLCPALLSDAHRAVRAAATNALVTRGSNARIDSDPALKSAVNEYRETLTYNADRPGESGGARNARGAAWPSRARNKCV